MSRSDHQGLMTTEDLVQAFRDLFPKAHDKELAALIAAFLEEVPPEAVLLDDGGVASADDADRETVAAWIGDLKEFAGDAYPPERSRASRH